MGYTQYWTFNPTKKTPEQFKIVLNEVKKIIEAKPEIKVFGWDDEKHGFYAEPTLKPEYINFNGDPENDLDYESFMFIPTEKKRNFCKTARKPYDLIVCTTLISLAKNLDRFTFASDGNMSDDEWIQAFQLYENLFGESDKVSNMKHWL